MTSTLPPLEIRCTSSDCENGLHCFRQSQRLMMANRDRQCRTCGVQLVDWKRVHKRNPDDAPYTFRTMKYELVRHHFWHLDIDQQALNHARRKGRVGMRLAAEKRIRKSVGPAEPPFDGRQTPKSGNALYYVQPATAHSYRSRPGISASSSGSEPLLGRNRMPASSQLRKADSGTHWVPSTRTRVYSSSCRASSRGPRLSKVTRPIYRSGR